MATYRYYTLSFVYHVNRKDIDESWERLFKEDPKNDAGFVASPLETRVTNYVESFVEAFLTGAGIDFRHEYSWPDGSCYKVIRLHDEVDIDKMVKLLNSRIEDKALYKLRIGGWTLVDPESTGLGKTAEQQFAEQPPL